MDHMENIVLLSTPNWLILFENDKIVILLSQSTMKYLALLPFVFN
jgi:hypothetical protein